jgi:peptidoglycan/LPS O-acetylase OafA/YrhL
MGSQFGIDALLFANGALITFIFMNKIDRTGRVRIWKMYIYRFMRVTPFIGIVIFFSMTLTKFTNDGPYYSFLTEAQIPACEEYWWSAMLHVQNYVNPDTIVRKFEI